MGSIVLTAFSLCSRLITPGILKYGKASECNLSTSGYLTRAWHEDLILFLNDQGLPRKFLDRGSSTLQSRTVPFLILSAYLISSE